MSPDHPPYHPVQNDAPLGAIAPELVGAVERLAALVHDQWAARRIAEGWRHGPERDEHRRLHPCLVPYDELPNDEKELDRSAVVETVRAMLALGYRPVGPRAPAQSESSAPGTAPELLVALNPAATPEELVRLWRRLRAGSVALAARDWATIGQRLIGRNLELLALDVLERGLQEHPSDLRLRQLVGHALARAGAVGRSQRVLAALTNEPGQAPRERAETLSLLARTHKDFGRLARGMDEQRRHWRLAFDLYREAFQVSGWSYPAVNAATLAVLLGDVAGGKALATEVRPTALQELANASAQGQPTYWELATIAELALIIGDRAEAKDRYQAAVAAAHGLGAQIASMRRNARVLLQAIDGTAEWGDGLFPVPGVAMFAGHMIDRPDRAGSRFPPADERLAAAAIAAALERHGVGIGFASASCGGDLLFHEELRQRGGSGHVILPFGREAFAVESVSFPATGDWAARFETTLEGAAEVIEATQQPFGDRRVFLEYGSQLVTGLAQLEAWRLDESPIAIALWDGQPGDGPGGTADLVQAWRALGLSLDVVALPSWQCGQSAKATPRPAGSRARLGGETQDVRICGIVFADAVHFSRLLDRDVRAFLGTYLDAVARVIAASAEPPLVSDTWGDGLYLVFPSARAAGLAALGIAEAVAPADWAGAGLPADLAVRVSVHAGPLFTFYDPVARRTAYSGRHATEAARIEPVTPPGEVYATREFAAVAAALVDEFRCELVGSVAMVKGAGVVPLYQVVRSAVRG
jgi:hypothetical protein